MPRKQPQLAKLSRPRLYKPVVRERLFRLLDEKREHPVVWVTGPPGAGKTTLAASYLAEAGAPAIWYQIDSEDSDPATFFFFLKQAVENAARRRAKPLPLLTPEYLHDLPGFARRFFRDAFARLPDDVLVVFDNYHEIGAASSLHVAFAAACAEVPPTANVIVLSRTSPPGVFAPGLLGQAIAPVSWHDLRLSIEETEAVAASRHVTDASVAQTLHAECDGWIAGLTLMLEFSKSGSLAGAARSETRETVYNYFEQVIFGGASADTREVMLRCSVLPLMTASLVEAITRDAQAIRHISALHRKHLFTSRTVGETDAYQFHALFRAFLLDKAAAELPEAQINQGRVRAASCAAEEGDLEQAFRLYLEAGEWNAVEPILIRLAPRLIKQGRWLTFGEWTGVLPPERLRDNPWLRYWLGRSRIFVDPVDARGILEGAYEACSKMQDSTGSLLSAAAVLEALYYDFRDFRPMDAWIDRISRLLQQGATVPDREEELRVYSVLMMGATYRMPEHPQLPGWVEHIKSMLREPLDRNLRVLAASMLHGYGNTVIDNDAELFAIGIGESLLGSPDVMALPATFYLKVEGYTHYMYGRYESAFASYDRAGKLARENGFGDLLLKIEIFRVLACRRAGRHDEAKAIVARLQAQCSSRTASVVVPFDFLKAILAFDRGDFDSAVAAAMSTVDITLQGAQYNGVMLVRIVCANMFIASGRFEFAGNFLREARADVCGPVTSHYLGAIDMNQAWLDLRQGRSRECREWLRQALARAVDYRARQRLRWYPNALSELLPIALEEGIRADIAQGLIREFEVTPVGAAPENWPWPVKVRTLGAFELLVDGKTPDYSRKIPRKVLALLKAIIAFGGIDVPEKRLCDALWPDDNGDAARRSLTAALHRLRKLLSHHDAIVQAEGRLSLHPGRCWVDALVASRKVNPPSEADAMLALYGGAFLDREEDMPWILPMRERLRARFIQVVDRRGAELERERQFQAAAELYQRGIEADSLVETFYQGLMRCLDNMDRKAEAASTYRRLRQMLSVALGVQPSPASQRLFESLRADPA